MIGARGAFKSLDFSLLIYLSYSYYIFLKNNATYAFRGMLARRILLNPVVRGYSKGRFANVFPADVNTVGENFDSDIDGLLADDRNMEFVCTIHDPMPARPAWLGLEGTELHSLRQLEAGNWGDLTADQQVSLLHAHRDHQPHSACPLPWLRQPDHPRNLAED